MGDDIRLKNIINFFSILKIYAQVADTWVNMTAWEKGHVIVNGHNIGRYWSKEGPQVNRFFFHMIVILKGCPDLYSC